MDTTNDILVNSESATPPCGLLRIYLGIQSIVRLAIEPVSTSDNTRRTTSANITPRTAKACRMRTRTSPIDLTKAK